MKYVIKAEDGMYSCCYSGYGTTHLESADLFSKEEAEFAFNNGCGKWAKGKAKIVPVTIIECEETEAKNEWSLICGDYNWTPEFHSGSSNT